MENEKEIKGAKGSSKEKAGELREESKRCMWYGRKCHSHMYWQLTTLVANINLTLRPHKPGHQNHQGKEIRGD